MIKEPPAGSRELLTKRLTCDLAVVGGGVAGVCCAITAARAGAKVVLINDRPVLGGNASSEVRLWILGATCHMGSNNRWAREGGVIDEILIENLHRNPEGNPIIVDTVLLEKVLAEPNITLLLNTAAFDASKADADTIASVRAFNSQNSTMYEVTAPLFCDASGDGIVGFVAGAAFRMGAESREEFGESIAPDVAEFGELLGHSIYFYAKDTGKPVRFTPPSFALKDITKIPRFARITPAKLGSHLWWLEWGGRLDTIHDTEQIKWELWKVVYGIWDYLKNSGKFPETETMTLEWVGHVPGKRESRRFEGPLMMTQQDVLEQRHHDDAVAFGGWSIDLHPADGVYSAKEGSWHWYAPGVYEIPYRCLYSRNIKNLFLAGRIISVSHVAFGTTRVMATLGYMAQAVGLAAAICAKAKLLPNDLCEPSRMKQLQLELMRRGQHIPGRRLEDPEDLAREAEITATSTYRLGSLPADGPWCRLEKSVAQMLPVNAGAMPKVSVPVTADVSTTLKVELRTSSRPDNHTPDVCLASREVALKAGEQSVDLDFGVDIDQQRYVFVCLMANDKVSVRCSMQRVTGVLTVWQGHRQRVSQADVPVFEFWTPRRRPEGFNMAITLDPSLDVFGPGNAVNGVNRPTTAPNAWLADVSGRPSDLVLRWDSPQSIQRIVLNFDSDFEHALESVQWNHPENVVPFCVKHYRVLDGDGRLLAECTDNYETVNEISLDEAVSTRSLRVQLVASHGAVPAALFGVRCYG